MAYYQTYSGSIGRVIIEARDIYEAMTISEQILGFFPEILTLYGMSMPSGPGPYLFMVEYTLNGVNQIEYFADENLNNFLSNIVQNDGVPTAAYFLGNFYPL